MKEDISEETGRCTERMQGEHAELHIQY